MCSIHEDSTKFKIFEIMFQLLMLHLQIEVLLVVNAIDPNVRMNVCRLSSSTKLQMKKEKLQANQNDATS